MRRNNSILSNGVIIDDFVVSHYYGDSTPIFFGAGCKETVGYIKDHPSDDASISLRILPGVEKNLINLLRTRQINHRIIGDGAICQHCGTTFIVGILKCTQCGSVDIQYSDTCQEKENIADISEWGIDDLGSLSMEEDDHYLHMNIDLVYRNFPKSITSEDVRRLVSISLFGAPTEWLCLRCGLFVDRDRITCPGCGGNKLSQRELSSLRRQCIYCLQDVIGGFACPDCAGRLREYIQ